MTDYLPQFDIENETHGRRTVIVTKTQTHETYHDGSPAFTKTTYDLHDSNGNCVNAKSEKGEVTSFWMDFGDSRPTFYPCGEFKYK